MTNTNNSNPIWEAAARQITEKAGADLSEPNLSKAVDAVFPGASDVTKSALLVNVLGIIQR